MKLRVLFDMIFIRTESEWLRVQDVANHCPHLEWSDIVETLQYLVSKGLMRIDDGGGMYRYSSTKEGKVFFAILRELITETVEMLNE